MNTHTHSQKDAIGCLWQLTNSTFKEVFFIDLKLLTGSCKMSFTQMWRFSNSLLRISSGCYWSWTNQLFKLINVLE